jgi:hypothetical protein
MSSLVAAEDLSIQEPLREEREVVCEAYLVDDPSSTVDDESMTEEHHGDQYQMSSDSDSDIEVVKVVPSRR